MRRTALLGSVALLAVAAAVILPSTRGAATALARTWRLEQVRLRAGEHVSVGFHPDVARAEISARSGRFEVCQAVMDGTAGGAPGTSWPTSAGFERCIRSDSTGRVLLPSIVVPTFHVAFLVRGIDATAVRLSELRVRYVPADGFFAFAVPEVATTFSLVPHEDRSISVEAVPRTAAAVPPGLQIRVRQGRSVGRVDPTGADGADARRYGPVRRGRRVVVRIAHAAPGADLAYVVRWA